MRRKRDRVNISVHPNFNKMLKVESALNGKSIYDFTREIGEKGMFITDYINKSEEGDGQNKKRVKFDFRL